jgi:hypothetical protein
MRILLVVFTLVLLPGYLFSQEIILAVQDDTLSHQSDSLQTESFKQLENQEQEELQRLQQSAQKKIQLTPANSAELKTKTFQQNSRSLQAFNPEISVTGDMLGKYLSEAPHYTEEERSGFSLRVVEVAVQSNLDPFSMAKVILEFSPEEIALAEAYATWINPLPQLNITAGKFKQQFGVLNRWHAHALDQISYPLPIEMFMGEEGLIQTGLSVNWLMPSLIAQVNELTIQVTNSENAILFSGEKYSLPATLLHLKNYYDLDPDTYFEWGVSGIAGTNDSLGLDLDQNHRWTYLAGLDLTLSWSPLNRALYKGITWRSELFYVRKELAGPDPVKAFGAYSYLDYRLGQRWIAGLRGDLAQPLESGNKDQYLWKIVPYFTFWQSEYVYFRFEFSHLEGKNLVEKDNRFTLQLNWSVGPHRHERY